LSAPEKWSSLITEAVREEIASGSVYIERGSSWGSGHCESFNSRLWDDLLNGAILHSLDEAKIVIESWRRHNTTE
jgi:hypothetical protein